MKTFRLFAALLVVALLTPPAFPQESSELTALMAKARRGNGIAQYNLGLAYAEGKGTAADPVEAFVWLSLARENGARGRALDNLIGSFDRNSLERAQHRLTERKAELGVRTPSPVNVRTETPAPPPKETSPAPAPAPVERPQPVPPPTDDAAARLQTERDNLSARLNEVSAEVTSLRAERERLIGLSAEQEKAAAAAKGELTRVRLALTAAQKAPKPAPDTAALDQKTHELQSALTELETARNFGQQVEATLNKVSDQKATLETALHAAESARDGYAREFEVSKSQLAELQNRASSADSPALAELKSANAALATQADQAKAEIAALTRARDEAVAAAAAKPAAPAYPNLTGKVAELEAQLAAATAQASSARQEIATLTLAGEAARKAVPAYPNLSGRVAELEAALVKARQPAAPAYPDLRSRVTELETQLATTEKSLAAKPAAPAYPDLRSNVTELETKVATLTAESNRAQQQIAALTQSGETTKVALAKANDSLSAKPAAPAYPDLSGRVAELESALTAASTGLAHAQAAAAQQSETLNAELKTAMAHTAQLQADLAARPAAPTYPDLSGKVAELQAQLAQVKPAAPATPAYPDLSGKVTEFAAALASQSSEAARAKQEMATLAKAKDDATQKATATELARAEVAKQFDDYKSATAAAQRERTTLLSNVKMLESDKISLRRQAESAGTEAGQLRTQVATLKEQLSAKSPAPAAPTYPDLSAKVAELEAQLVKTREPVTPAYPDLSGRVRELESALAARPASPAYPDLSGRVAELESAFTAASTSLAQAQAALAAKPSGPSYPDLSDKVAELRAANDRLTQENSRLVAASTATPAYPDYTGLVQELTGEVTKLRAGREGHASELAASTNRVKELEAQVGSLQATLAAAPATPAYPDLSGKVTELQIQLAKAREPVAPAAPAYPDLSGRVSELETQLAQAKAAPAVPAQTDVSGRVAGLESALADSARKLVAADSAQTELRQQLVTAQAASKTKGDADAQLGRERDELTGRVTVLGREVAQLRGDRERMQKMLGDAGRQMRDSSADASRIKELEAQSTGLQTSLAAAQSQTAELQAALAAKPATPAYPDLSGKVAELETQLAAKPVLPNFPDLREHVAELERELAAARTSAPVYPDLSGKVAELEAQLAASPKSRPPAYPNLAGRVVELETALADTKRQLSEKETALLSATHAAPPPVAAVAPETDVSDLKKRLAETEDRLATALRGYALLEKDRDALQAKSGQASEAQAADKNSLTAQVATLTAQVQQLQVAAAAQATAEHAASSLITEKEALAARLAEMEGRANAAQAEATRMGESLAALQRSTGQAASEAAATRALTQQLQGTNAVLAQENYQLKTMLARTTGSPAPVAVPVSSPAGRTHVVVSGDSLSKISQRYYGTASRWQEIYNANTGKLGPNGVLRVGTELRIP